MKMAAPPHTRLKQIARPTVAEYLGHAVEVVESLETDHRFAIRWRRPLAALHPVRHVDGNR
jgi:hypothetical protein